MMLEVSHGTDRCPESHDDQPGKDFMELLPVDYMDSEDEMCARLQGESPPFRRYREQKVIDSNNRKKKRDHIYTSVPVEHEH